MSTLTPNSTRLILGQFNCVKSLTKLLFNYEIKFLELHFQIPLIPLKHSEKFSFLFPLIPLKRSEKFSLEKFPLARARELKLYRTVD